MKAIFNFSHINQRQLINSLRTDKEMMIKTVRYYYIMNIELMN